MEKLGLNDIREKFLSFFETKEHLRLPSASLIPKNDPSLLLINSGMAPLKPYFTGEQTPPRKRVTTCQKCVRTLDIDNVGKTARHGTYFEMLGNFSFGDYFKHEAISWAWEFVTEVMEIPIDKLYVTIYEDDDEAFEIWNKEIGVAADRIVRLGKEDNFWEHGLGPCGPCSEIYFDRGEENGCGSPDCGPGCDCDRFVEFWNLVFTQFCKMEDGSYEKLDHPNIDTGMGLERLACIMQGVSNLFEVDTVISVLRFIGEAAGTTYGDDTKKDVSMRVIADHIRGSVMLISDGVLPANDGKGYVLKRLLRRAARHARLLGIDKAFLGDVAEVVIDQSKQGYPELIDNHDRIIRVIKDEEKRFSETIDQGLGILNEFIEEAASGDKVIKGTDVFRLHDTYGFPIDLTREIAEEQGLTIDEEGFNEAMKEQKAKGREAFLSKEGSAWEDNVFSSVDAEPTEFVGYETLSLDTGIKYVFADNVEKETVSAGDQVVVITDKTPFYAEMGGQTADTGVIRTDDGVIEVANVNKIGDGVFLHIGEVKEGTIHKGDIASFEVDADRRMDIARNHTATHILQKALSEVLGDHVSQAGSSVDDNRLRFDFTHFEAMTPDELQRVSDRVNEIVYDSFTVDTKEMSVDEARATGAKALFGEKYGDVVRVVSVGEYSKELCGGTHVSNSAQIGLIKILGESGVAAGVRRIEALTGKAALKYYMDAEKTLHSVADLLKTGVNDVEKRAESVVTSLRNTEKELEKIKNEKAAGDLDSIIDNAEDVNGVRLIANAFDGMDADTMRNLGDSIRDKCDEAALLFASSNDGKVVLVCMASKGAVAKGIHCGNIVKEAAKICGGGGGGRPDMAQAGGKDPAAVNDAVTKAIEIMKEQLS